MVIKKHGGARRTLTDKGPAIRCNASLYGVEKADLIKWYGGITNALKHLHKQGNPITQNKA